MLPLLFSLVDGALVIALLLLLSLALAGVIATVIQVPRDGYRAVPTRTVGGSGDSRRS